MQTFKNRKILIYVIPFLTLLGLILGLFSTFLGYQILGQLILKATLVLGTLPLLWRMAKDLYRGHFGIDLIAMLAIITSFILGQNLAGTVIVLMLSGGEALEDYALKRSSRELTKLLSLAPTVGHLKIGTSLRDIPAEQIKIGDIVLVKPGEIVPVDGTVIAGVSEMDESSITGESLLVEKFVGSGVFSGSLNKGAALEISVQKEAHESQYQRIVKLVKGAQNSKAPMVRLADRYAVGFTLMTLALSLGAWFFSRDAIRFLAVLVVATPCPLILATPIAIISGISKSASRGIIVKNGGALETLGEAKAMVFDKTGTLTLGEPKVLGANAANSSVTEKQILFLAASLDQLSIHALARALVKHVKTQITDALHLPTDFKEVLGNGVSGNLAGKTYLFGKLSFLKEKGVIIEQVFETEHARYQNEGKIIIYLAEDIKLLGSIAFADIIRPEMKQVFKEIAEHKIKRIFMLTGDKYPVAQKISAELGIKEFKAEMLPEDKATEVTKIKALVSPLAMVGDGINDAPALAAADVGIALAFHGSSASSESADIVIMQNNLMRVHDAVHIAQTTMRIAKQSIFAGLGLSILLMIIAAFGYISPIYGAMLQEVIDVAVILNALRVNFEKV